MSSDIIQNCEVVSNSLERRGKGLRKKPLKSKTFLGGKHVFGWVHSYSTPHIFHHSLYFLHV